MTVRNTTLEPYKADYEKVLSFTGLENDPFPVVAPNEVTYWADNKELFIKIKETLIDSLLFASSNLYIFWGRVGVGKTFAANYLCGPKGLELFKSELPNSLIKNQYSIKIRTVIPRRSGEVLNSIYNGIVKKFIIDIIKDKDLKNELKEYYKKMEVSKLRNAFRLMSIELRKMKLDNSHIQLENNEGYKFITDEKNKIGKLRDINEMGEVIISLISILLTKFERVSIIIDEFEHLSRATVAERYQVNDLIKCIYEYVDVGLNIILIYTFETYSEVEITLQAAIKDRIKSIIEFELINNEADVVQYIYECIEQRGNVNPHNLIDEDIIKLFAKKLIDEFGQISFRQINREMHRFISICFRMLIEQKKSIEVFNIDKELYQIFNKYI